MDEDLGRSAIEKLMDAYPRLAKEEQQELCEKKYALQQKWKQDVLDIPEVYRDIVAIVKEVTKPFTVTSVQNNNWKKQRDAVVVAAEKGSVCIEEVLELALKDAVYLAEYRAHISALSKDKQTRIETTYAAYKQVAERLALHNLRLVWKYARTLHDQWHEISDTELFSEGFQGLCKAIEHFNPAKKTQLSTYAVPRIILEMEKCITKTKQIVHVADRAGDLVKKAEVARNIFYLHAGRYPTQRELRAVLDISKETFQGLKDGERKTVSLDEIFENNDFPESFAVHSLPTQSDGEEEKKQVYERLLGILSEREQYIVCAHIKGNLIFEIAHALKLSERSVRKIKKRAVQKMQAEASKLLLNGKVTIRRSCEQEEWDTELGEEYHERYVVDTRRVMQLPKKKKKSYEIIAFLASQEAT